MPDDADSNTALATIVDLRRQLEATQSERDAALQLAKDVQAKAQDDVAEAQSKQAAAEKILADTNTAHAAQVAGLNSARDRQAMLVQRANAETNTVRAELKDATDQLDGLRTQVQVATDKLKDAQVLADRIPALEDKVTNLQTVVAQFTEPLPPGVTEVHYLDEKGNIDKKRLRATDGTKFSLRPDADAHQAALDIVRTVNNMPFEMAKEIVAQRKALKQVLDPLNLADAATEGAP